MNFEKGYLYHIYNQGNNKQKIFYKRDNYLFFLKKINVYILPYADVLAWCLMPNHFHLMLLIKNTQLKKTHLMTSNRNEESHLMSGTKFRTLNISIAILLRTYTRAINMQENRTGSLFKPHTKAECINCFKGPKSGFIDSNISISNLIAEKQYPQVCFNYIHQNPVNAGLVKSAVDWEFSSSMDYAGLRKGKLINKDIADEYVEF